MSGKARVGNLPFVSRETLQHLQAYVNLLVKWNPKINLVAKSTLKDAWERHILDSAQTWVHRPDSIQKWCDIGSGAGFPGLVLAVIAKEEAPDVSFHLVESDARKCSFLRTVARELDLSVEVHTQRVESIEEMTFDVVSARALASVSDLLNYARPILAPNGVCLFLKGKDCAKEIAEAEQDWRFEVESFESLTAADASILRVSKVDRIDG